MMLDANTWTNIAVADFVLTQGPVELVLEHLTITRWSDKTNPVSMSRRTLRTTRCYTARACSW